MKWQEAGLPKPSLIKPVFATIERGLVLRKLGALQGQEHVTGWLLRVARNRIADLFRKRRPESFSDAAPTGEDDEPARPEDPGVLALINYRAMNAFPFVLLLRSASRGGGSWR